MRRLIALTLLAASLSGPLAGWICVDDCMSVSEAGATACHGSSAPADVIAASHGCMSPAPPPAPAIVTRQAPSGPVVLVSHVAPMLVLDGLARLDRPMTRAIPGSPPLSRTATPLRI